MRGMRRRAARVASALLMVALLVVPVVASAHTHRDPGAARSCATCVAAHHSPAIVVPVIQAAAPVRATVAPALPSRVAPAHSHRSPRAGRAPPALAPVSVS
jgi:hypothetical protein